MKPRPMFPKIGVMYFGDPKKVRGTTGAQQLVKRDGPKTTFVEKKLAEKIVNDMANGILKLQTPERVQKYGTKDMDEIIMKLREMEIQKMRRNGPKQPELKMPSPKKVVHKVVRDNDNFTLQELKNMMEQEKKEKKKPKAMKMKKMLEKIRKEKAKVDKAALAENVNLRTKKEKVAKLPVMKLAPEKIAEVENEIKNAKKQIAEIKKVLDKGHVELKRPVPKKKTTMKPKKETAPRNYIRELGYNNTRIGRKSKKNPDPYRQKNLMNIAKALNMNMSTKNKFTDTELIKYIQGRLN